MALLRRTTKTKKSPFKFTEETPQPSLTRGTTVTQGRDVQRIDLTNNKKFAEYATKAKQRETEPIFTRSSNGAFTGVKSVKEDNIMTAQNNLAKARTLANQGASYEEVKMNVGDAVAQLDLAERQLYEASKSKYEYKTNARDKLAKLRQYKREIMPDQIALIELALQKPTPEYINGGGQ